MTRRDKAGNETGILATFDSKKWEVVEVTSRKQTRATVR